MKAIRTIIMMVMIAVALEFIPNTNALAYETKNDSPIKYLDVTGDNQVEYIFTKDILYIQLDTTDPGLASFYVTLTGIKSKAKLALYGCSLIELKKILEESTSSNTASLTDVLLGGREIAPDSEQSAFSIGNDKPQSAVMVISIAGVERIEGMSVKASVRSEFTSLTTETSEIESGKQYSFAQAPGDLYWPVNIDSLSMIRFDGSSWDCKLCDKNKDLISNMGTLIIKPGSYYIKTTNQGKTATRIKFSCIFSSVSTPIGTNTSKKKAKNIQFNKKYSGTITTVPSFNAHYYKFTLTKSRKRVKLFYSNSQKEMSTIWLYSKNGSLIAYGTTEKESGILKWTNFESEKEVSSLKLKKGVYFIKIEKSIICDADGIYSFKLKQN